jgi:hypothetical protein
LCQQVASRLNDRIRQNDCEHHRRHAKNSSIPHCGQIIVLLWNRGRVTGCTPRRATDSASLGGGDEPVHSCLGVRSPRGWGLVRGLGFAVGFNALPQDPLRLEDSAPPPLETGEDLSDLAI